MSKNLGKLLRNLLPRPFEQIKIPSGVADANTCCSQHILIKKEQAGRQFPIPHGLDPGAIEWKNEFFSTAQELWCFDRATVDSHSSLVNQEGMLIEKLSEHFSQEIHPKFSFRWSNLFKPTHYHKKKIYNLSHLNDTHPYHWLLDGIARLSLIDQAPVDALYIPQSTSYQRESLALAMQNLQIHLPVINASQVHDLKADQIFTPSFALFGEKQPIAPAQWACEFVSTTLGKPFSERMRRIYISRSDASYRRVLNEDALVDLLSRSGFESVVMSDLSFKQQRDLFAQSEAIVAPHGGALAHLLFCAPGTKVLEIFYPHYMPPCYWQISSYCDLDYAFCQAEPLDSSEKHWPYEDIFVDLDKIRKMLEMLKLN